MSAAMMAAANAMQAAEMAPTAREIAACAAARTQSATVMAKWNGVTTSVTALNAKRKAAGLPVITIGK